MKGKPQIKDTEVLATYEKITSPESEENWFVFTCTDKDDVILVGSGKGTIEDVGKAMKDKDISIGFLKMAEDAFGLVSCISIEATSERTTSALLMLQEAKLLFTHHYYLDFTRAEEFTLDALKAGMRDIAEVEASKVPLKKRSTLKKKKDADGEDKIKKKKKGEDGAEDGEGEGTKRRNTVKKKKSEKEVGDAAEEVKKMTLEKTDSSNGLRRGKSVKKKTDAADDSTEKRSKKKADGTPETPVIAVHEAPLERAKSTKAPKPKKNNNDELRPVEHTKELSGSSSPMYRHSRDPSASSEISEEGSRQYCKALNYNLAKSPDDLMFVKGDIIQIVEKISDTCWLGICCGVEGVFDPALVSVLPPGYRPKMDASGSEVSMDSFSDIMSESEYDEDEVAGRTKARAGEFSEPMVVEWLYSAGFPQYVDMYQKRQVINEGEVVHDHSFLSPLQIQSLLKRIRFLNAQTQKSMGTEVVDVQQYQNADALPISPMWNDSNPPATPTNPGYDSLPASGTQPANWGENLTRSKSKKKKKARGISELDARELDIARKLAVLSITAMQEKSNKSKVTDFAVKTFNKMVGKKEEKEAKIFGGDLQEIVERTGVPSKWTTGVIPKCLFKMFEALEKEEILKTVGLFRVPGKQNRINQIRDQCDATDGDVDFSGLSGADLSGLLKLFFAKLPDSLFTSELYKSYISVASMTNKRVQIETLQLLSILLPKENREIAACLLKFLSQVSQHKEENKMDTKNIALVLAPTLFGDKRRKAMKPSQADIDKDLQRQNKIAEVLQVMIDCQSVLWMLPVDLQEQLEYTSQGGKSEKKKKWFFTTNKYPTL